MAEMQSILKRKAEKFGDLVHPLLNRDEMFSFANKLRHRLKQTVMLAQN